MTPELVVKLGGSHVGSRLLRNWLRAIAAAEGGLVLVPGGGSFADAVRRAQPVVGFDDSAAHDMALMAMAQYGRALASLEPRLELADSADNIRFACVAGRIPVWSPWPMLRGAPDIPTSWDVTSDSLALWLASALKVPRLLLIKHRAAPVATSCRLLARDGLIDAAFSRFLPTYTGEIRFAGPDDVPVRGLNTATPPGVLVPP